MSFTAPLKLTRNNWDQHMLMIILSSDYTANTVQIIEQERNGKKLTGEGNEEHPILKSKK